MVYVPPPLPVELIDMVIEHLHPRDFCSFAGHYAKRDISSCALVCRSWASLVRPHVFREIDYTFFGPETGRYAQEDGICSNPRTFQMLHAFLAASPAVARHVRKLRLLQDVQVGCEPIPYDEFLAFLDVVPNLRELYLCDVAIFRKRRVAYPRSTRSLDKLHISFGSSERLWRSLSFDIRAQIACARQIGEVVLSNLEEVDFTGGDPDTGDSDWDVHGPDSDDDDSGSNEDGSDLDSEDPDSNNEDPDSSNEDEDSKNEDLGLNNEDEDEDIDSASNSDASHSNGERRFRLRCPRMSPLGEPPVV